MHLRVNLHLLLLFLCKVYNFFLKTKTAEILLLYIDYYIFIIRSDLLFRRVFPSTVDLILIFSGNSESDRSIQRVKRVFMEQHYLLNEENILLNVSRIRGNKNKANYVPICLETGMILK